MQQLSICFYLIFLFVPHLIDFLSFKRNGQSITWLDDKMLHFSSLAIYIKNVFYLENYAFSLLQSLGYATMICNPIYYKDYIDKKNMLKRVGLSVLLPFLFSIDNLADFVLILISLWYHNSSKTTQYISLNWPSARYNMAILQIVKIALLKVFYTTVMIVLAVNTYQTLNQSQNILNTSRKVRSTLFAIASIVPLVNNLLYLCSDVETAVFPILNDLDLRPNGHYYAKSINYIYLPITACIMLSGSVLQCIAYLICFPRLREDHCILSWIQCSRQP